MCGIRLEGEAKAYHRSTAWQRPGGLERLSIGSSEEGNQDPSVVLCHRSASKHLHWNSTKENQTPLNSSLQGVRSDSSAFENRFILSNLSSFG